MGMGTNTAIWYGLAVEMGEVVRGECRLAKNQE